MRYQIVYCKRGWPLTTWADNADRARKLAEQLRSTGYSVDVWQHTKDGAQKNRHLTRLMMAAGTGRNAPHGASREPPVKNLIFWRF